MTELDTLIQNAYQSEGATADVNKVYLAFLKTELYIPAEIHSDAEEHEEPYTPLFTQEGDFIFMLAFDSLDKLHAWAGEAKDEFDHVTLLGRDLIAGIGDQVFLALNPGSEFYKEISPEEIQRLKTMVAKVAALTKESNQ